MVLGDDRKRQAQHVGNEYIHDQRETEAQEYAPLLQIKRSADDAFDKFHQPLHEILQSGRLRDGRLAHRRDGQRQHDDARDDDHDDG